MDQVSVGAVDRDHIHPASTQRRAASANDRTISPISCVASSRGISPPEISQGTGDGDRLEARDERLRDAPGVDQFHAEQGALGVHRAGEDPEAWDHVVVVGTHLAQASAPVCTDIGGLGEQQRRAPRRGARR